MYGPWERLLRRDDRMVRSFRIAEGQAMPNVGDVMVFGPPAALLRGQDVLACRVEGTMNRTVFYVPYPDDELPLGGSTWRMRRVRTGRRRFEEVATRR